MIYIKRKNKSHGLYHLYKDGDTVCRMASTGGLDMKNYDIVTDVSTLTMCHQCSIVTTKKQLLIGISDHIKKAEVQHTIMCPHCGEVIQL